MTRWIQNASLAARFIVLLMLALLLSQLVTLAIFWDERGTALRQVAKADFLSRSASLSMLLDNASAEQRQHIIQVSNTAFERFWLFREAPSRPSQWWFFARKHLVEPLRHGQVPAPTALSFRPDQELPPTQIDASADWTTPSPLDWPAQRPARFIDLPQLNVMGVTTPLRDGLWLHAVYAKPVQDSPLAVRPLMSLAITAVALSLIAILIARGISRPLRNLARAAERLGRGEAVEPLSEAGPIDIKRTAQAFNQMHGRIRRYVDDRTLMLASIGHDLRTPLTSLRLRVEFIEDLDIRQKMEASLDEITCMTDAAIEYAKQNADNQATRSMDIGALVESLCLDLADLGMDVRFEPGPKVILECRPIPLRRAFRNLIENAVRYGKSATVSVLEEPGYVQVLIEDQGSGIAESEMELVFTPFYRVEQSRNRNTGGVGLGLSITRSIVRQHGGDVVLANQPQGLLVTVSLPKE